MCGRVQPAQNERGAAAVEFALVAMLLVTLLIGIMEFGYAFFVQGTIAGSAREAAREYAIHKNETDAISAAREAADVLPEGDTMTVAIPAGACPSTPPAGSMPAVTVTITYPYAGGLTGFFPFIPNLKATGTMRCNG